MIHFFSHQACSFALADPPAVAAWLTQVAHQEGFSVEELTYVFGRDAYLYRLNKRYLAHETYTDILAFDYHTPDLPLGQLAGELFISVERVAENAKARGLTLAQELGRVMVHGLLHLTGHRDKTPYQRAQMRQQEDLYLQEAPCSALEACQASQVKSPR